MRGMTGIRVMNEYQGCGSVFLKGLDPVRTSGLKIPLKSAAESGFSPRGSDLDQFHPDPQLWRTNSVELAFDGHLHRNVTAQYRILVTVYYRLLFTI